MRRSGRTPHRGWLGGILIGGLLSAGLWAVSPRVSEAGPRIEAVEIKLRSTSGQLLLNRALTDPAFWGDASSATYHRQLYDEIRLKPLPSGHICMVTGEGDRDFDQDVVADIVFVQQTGLPRYMDGAKVVKALGTGVDPELGVPYSDTFFLLDLTFFYATYLQRMYRKDDGSGRTILWFEKIEPEFVDAATWAEYNRKAERALIGVDLRWALNSVIPIGEIHGMFIVEPGGARKSRVSMVTRMAFGDDASWIAKVGSEMPSVLKAGLKSGFNASVALAVEEQERRP